MWKCDSFPEGFGNIVVAKSLSDFTQISKAANAAAKRIIDKGSDDVFRPPIFSQSIESSIISAKQEEFKSEAVSQAIKFLSVADLKKERIGMARKGLVTKDQHSFRQVAWLDPFDAVKYLSVALMFFEKIEAARPPKEALSVHSHRMSVTEGDIFDASFGYDSFRTC